MHELRQGRMISSNKAAPKGHICVFNANLCTREGGKFWFGDLDLTVDAEPLKKIAAEKGVDVYVLREIDARFMNEENPRLENYVARITPSGEIVFSECAS